MIYKYDIVNESLIKWHSQFSFNFHSNNMTHIIIKPSHMFKPSLKRTTPTVKTHIEPHQIQTHPTILTKKSTFTPQYSTTPSFLVPSALFSNILTQGTSLLFTPLNYEWVEYPQTALQMIENQPLGDFIARDIGSYAGVFWFFNGQDILVWRQGSRQEKRFQLPQKTDFVALGELQSSSLHFKSKNMIIMAAGCQNFVHLFGLNRETLDCEDFKFCYQVANSGYIQKIRFINKEELIVVSDTGQHYLLDFKSQLKVCRPDLHFLKRPLPYFPFLFPQKQNFYEQVLVSGDYICSLVREERKANWFSVKAKQIVNSLLSRNHNVQWIIEERVLEFYQINRQTSTISLRFKLKESQILTEIKGCNFNNQTQETPTIVAINLKKDCPYVVEVAFSSGLFLEVDISKDLRLTKQPITIPPQSIIGTIGFFLQTKIPSAYQQEHTNTVTVLGSLGINGLTVLRDSLCYRSSTHIEVVKNSGFKGKLLQIKKELLGNQRWVFMTGKGFFKIQRLVPSDVIIGLMAERDRLDTLNVGKKWAEPNIFQLFMDSLVSSIGPEKIIESLITVFLKDRRSIRLHPELVRSIERDLEGSPRPNIRDWSFQLLSHKVSPVTITITEKMRHQMMQLIVQLSNKLSKSQPSQLSSEKIVGAYWQAVKSIFHEITCKIVDLEPKDMKLNREQIKEAQEMLQKLSRFFSLKSQKEKRLRNQFYILAKEQRQPQEDFYSYFKRKQYLQPQRKLQDSIDTQAETIPDQKYVTESSKALENDIILATQKLNSMIAVFVILADISQNVRIGSLKEALGSIQSQMLIKVKLIEKCADPDKLWEFNAKLPELELHKDLRLLPWMQKAKNYKWLDMFNLEEISSWLSQPYLKKVLGIFQQRLDLQMELLLHYWKQNGQDIALASQLFELQSTAGHLYSVDRKKHLSQRISYCRRQQELVSEQLQVIISKATKAYVESEEENYPQAERILNSIIQLTVSKGEERLCNYIQIELARIKVAEKIKLFKNLRIKSTSNTKETRALLGAVVLKKSPMPSDSQSLAQKSSY